jgi:hypothetical protein
MFQGVSRNKLMEFKEEQAKEQDAMRRSYEKVSSPMFNQTRMRPFSPQKSFNFKTGILAVSGAK